ncbi:RNA polymerase II degradation factor 1-like [Rhagoletis pomonella]|uniref:RNA polymerase II degradation factor 1-like n=1 Tax=Rhagoletis pomonella TaxID=28610 RepID=UPI00178017E1|nr:RNA polymerase II degradation factor 1-like [Rhagoletis pomonella]
MPNYRQKNKKNKNKNRQKQQQQQNQQDNKNKSQNQNQQANQPSATQNRQSTGNKDNQSQGRARREQSNQQQPPKSPKSPTPTTTATATTRPTPLAPADEPVNSSQQHHASSQDAREVDSTATTANASTATIFVQSDNLSSNEPSDFAAPTSSHQAITAAVDREECNRVEDADADALLSILDNKEAATYSEETAHSFRSEKGVEEFTMGNKDSKTSITSNDATALATTDDRAVATATADLCGVIRPDRTIVGARELETLQPATKTQMAKVIVHRIVRESSENGEGEKEKERQKDEDIDKVAQVARAGKQKLAQATEERQKTAVNDGQIGEHVLHEQLQSAADDVDGAQKSQRSKVIIHNIEQQAGGGGVGVSLQPAKAESKVIVHPIQQEVGNEAKKLHTSEGCCGKQRR